MKAKVAASTAKPGYTLPPLAISIVRFSSPKQAEGDSYRRQLAASQEFCEQKNWELDLSLHERMEQAEIRTGTGRCSNPACIVQCRHDWYGRHRSDAWNLPTEPSGRSPLGA